MKLNVEQMDCRRKFIPRGAAKPGQSIPNHMSGWLLAAQTNNC